MKPLLHLEILNNCRIVHLGVPQFSWFSSTSPRSPGYQYQHFYLQCNTATLLVTVNTVFYIYVGSEMHFQQDGWLCQAIKMYLADQNLSTHCSLIFVCVQSYRWLSEDHMPCFDEKVISLLVPNTEGFFPQKLRLQLYGCQLCSFFFLQDSFL